MSNYEKQNFVSGQILKAEHLNHMEDGIGQLSEEIVDQGKAIDALSEELFKTRKYSLSAGTVDSVTGDLGYVANNRLRTTDKFMVRRGDRLEHDPETNNYQYALFVYDADGNYLKDESVTMWTSGNTPIMRNGYVRLNVRKKDDGIFDEYEKADVLSKIKIYALKADETAVFSVNGIYPDERGNVDIAKSNAYRYTLVPGTYWNSSGGVWTGVNRARTYKIDVTRGTKITFDAIASATYKYAVLLWDENGTVVSISDWLVAPEYIIKQNGAIGINIMCADGRDITDADIKTVSAHMVVNSNDEEAARADLINSLTIEFGRSDGASWQYVRIPHKTNDGRTVRPIVRLTSTDGALDGKKYSVPTYAERENTAFVINAGLFDVSTNQPIGQTIIDGVSIVNEPHPQGANGETISETECYPLCIDGNGILSAPYPKTVDTATMIADGIVQATTGWVKLVEDYEIASGEIATEIVHPGPYVQQIIGQFFDGDYCVLSVARRGYTGSDPNDAGLTYTQCAQLLVDKGVKFAYALDGGGSAQTVVGKRQINPKYDGRAAPSVIVFEAL